MSRFDIFHIYENWVMGTLLGGLPGAARLSEILLEWAEKTIEKPTKKEKQQ